MRQAGGELRICLDLPCLLFRLDHLFLPSGLGNPGYKTTIHKGTYYPIYVRLYLN